MKRISNYSYLFKKAKDLRRRKVPRIMWNLKISDAKGFINIYCNIIYNSKILEKKSKKMQTDGERYSMILEFGRISIVKNNKCTQSSRVNAIPPSNYQWSFSKN